MCSLYQLFNFVLRNSVQHMSRVGECVSELLHLHGITPKAKILEVGPKEGALLISLANMGYEVAALEIMESEGEIPGVIPAKFPIRSSKRSEIKNAFEGTKFDAIIISRVGILGNSKYKDIDLLRNLRSLTREGGILAILMQPNRDYLLRKSPSSNLIKFENIHVKLEQFVDLYSSTLRTRCSFYRKLEDGKLEFMGEEVLNMRVYSLHELIEICEEAGWKFLAAYSDLSTLAEVSEPFDNTLNLVALNP